MRHPRLNRQASTRVSIPLLEGGINTFDGATHIQDKQLIDAKNVWFDGATLRTRPKIKDVTGIGAGGGTQGSFFANKIFKEIETVYGKVFVCLKDNGNKGLDNIIVIKFEEKDGAYYAKVSQIVSMDGRTYERVNCWLGNDGYIYSLIELNVPNTQTVVMYKTDASNLKSEPILEASYDYTTKKTTYTNDKLYAPLLYMNGKGNRYSELPITNETEYPVASAYEGKNMLPSACRFQFITDGYSDGWEVPINVDKHCAKITLNTLGMGFTDIYKCKNPNYASTQEEPEYDTKNNLTDKTIEFKFSDEYTLLSDEEYFVCGSLNCFSKDDEGNFYEETYEIGSDEGTCYEYNGKSGARFRAMFDRNSSTLSFVRGEEQQGVSGSGTAPKDFVKTVLPNSKSADIELVAYKNPFEYMDKLLDMNVSALYGGGDGIYGGSRVFLAGCENYFCYSNSADGKETYFSENNFVRVDNKEPIVALKQMGEALVIFKEKSIYQTVTAYSDSVSASDVQDGKVVDMATTYVYFPISTLNDTIGCDLPSTVKLCLNRLVWATKSGKVYCLVTQSNSSQRNVYCISETIERKFFEYGKCLLKDGAFAVRHKDYYLLFSGKKVWALNYNKDSFRYVYSYTNKTTNASTRYFTWWYWELDKEFFGADDKDGVAKLFLRSDEPNSNGDYQYFIYKIDETQSEDDCDVSIETKIFDFGVPERYKKIEKIFIGVGNDIYADIDLIIHTDKGDIYHRQFSVDNNEQESRFTAEYGDGIRIIPIANKIKQFGIKITGRGVMSIESIGIYYKMLGEVMS